MALVSPAVRRHPYPWTLCVSYTSIFGPCLATCSVSYLSYSSWRSLNLLTLAYFCNTCFCPLFFVHSVHPPQRHTSIAKTHYGGSREQHNRIPLAQTAWTPAENLELAALFVLVASSLMATAPARRRHCIHIRARATPIPCQSAPDIHIPNILHIL
ncbi:hypothetical protein BCR34DRAFT_43383 [Clohesyomyces aquaticus]|uniref:Uncharacterized protein n=1 Tax=Clohesyomyces aquaticus TaxID=1231657 RepID=A0A1Y1Z5X3_9PLEO|nr:hypothetical protein BCR34DRAFT_43383 [Clohesyomyces aquaticus]